MIIAIDGRIGSGKTYVSNYIKDNYNFNVINLDDVAKLAYEDSNIKKKVLKLLEISYIDFDIIRKIIFTDKVKKKKLEIIIYQYLFDYINKQKDTDLIVEGYNSFTIYPNYDLGIVVCCDEDIRKQRVLDRNKDEEYFRLIDFNQKDIYPLHNYTFCINNNGQDFNKEIDRIISYAKDRENC